MKGYTAERFGKLAVWQKLMFGRGWRGRQQPPKEINRNAKNQDNLEKHLRVSQKSLRLPLPSDAIGLLGQSCSVTESRPLSMDLGFIS